MIIKNLRGWDIFGEITDAFYPIINTNKIMYIEKRKYLHKDQKEIDGYDIYFIDGNFITLCEESFKKIMKVLDPDDDVLYRVDNTAYNEGGNGSINPSEADTE